MNAEVKNYADERAARVGPVPLDPEDIEAVDEITAALARAEDLEEPAAAVALEPALSPLAAQWLRFRDQFAEAMEGGLYKVDDLERMIFTGKAYFWPGAAAAVVAERVVYPSGEAVLQTLWAVGDLAEVLTLEPALASTARLVGCTRILIEGRKGWEKLMKPAGYEPWSVTLSKEL